MSTVVKSTVAAIAVAAMAPFAASAASISDIKITSIVASWQNPVPATVSVDNSGDTKEARWGVPATAAGQSGYDFTAETTPVTVSAEVAFDLGEFVHINQPIRPGGSLQTIELVLDIAGELVDDPSVMFSLSSVFDFTHLETPNRAPCLPGSVSVCDDLVTVALNVGKSTSFEYDSVKYFFSVTGFEVAGVSVTEFLTAEGANNPAILRGVFTAKVNEVPLPAAGWMLLAGLGALAAAARKRSI